MLDIKNLSKYKYIYHIYKSEDNQLHMEHYPIIYINDYKVYFKTGRKQDLSYQYMKNIYNTNEHENSLRKYHKWYDKYILADDKTDVQNIFDDVKQQHQIDVSKAEEKIAYIRYEKAKKEFEEALTAIEVIEQLKRKAKEKKDGNKNQENK